MCVAMSDVVVDVFLWAGPHLSDDGHAQVGHVRDDVTVFWGDVGVLEELTQVLLTDP